MVINLRYLDPYLEDWIHDYAERRYSKKRNRVVKSVEDAIKCLMIFKEEYSNYVNLNGPLKSKKLGFGD